MGDRGNVYIHDSKEKVPGVYLYTHWRGSELPEVVQAALKRRQRWHDNAYLARIVFCEMIKGDESGETGFGISARIGDNSHAIVVVDCAVDGGVSFMPEDRAARVVVALEGAPTWTFEAYIALDAKALYRAWREASGRPAEDDDE